MRIDGIFLKKDLTNRKCDIEYRAGDVTPVSNNTTKELLLCKISVGSGTSSITQAVIEDMRATEQCGFVAGAVQQLSVSELYAQFTEQFNQWMEAEQQSFTTWFNGIKGQLSTDAAGNLQLQIEDLKVKSRNYSYDEETCTLSITSGT